MKKWRDCDEKKNHANSWTEKGVQQTDADAKIKQIETKNHADIMMPTDCHRREYHGTDVLVYARAEEGYRFLQ